ncbi:hypothetical protein PanWU01x14_362620 [Parasponia andersonii]|uniref:Uncharacterized protein n=1 Tax=Parasponia andersonii TaxID=3476 RepID=A0A2P5A6W8_PARAD|nr:hypothetical protein PanWU01x14_362620 [Parasponia andersonii]
MWEKITYWDQYPRTLRGYLETLKLGKGIDLSSIILTGEIPREITELIELLSWRLPSSLSQIVRFDELNLSKQRTVWQNSHKY